MQASSEGSLLLMVAGSLDTKWNQRYDKERREHERVGKGGGGGSGIFSREESGGD